MYTSSFGDELLQEILRNAADWGHVFDSKDIEEIRINGVHLTPASDRSSSGRTVENNSSQSETRNQEGQQTNVAPQSQTTQEQSTPTSNRPSSGRTVGNSTPSGTRNPDRPQTNPRPQSQLTRVPITPVTDSPSSGRTAGNSSSSGMRNPERPPGDPSTVPNTTRTSAVSARVSEANTGTRSRESAGDLEEELAVVVIGLRSATGHFEHVVTSMKVGSCPSVEQVMDHLKEDEEEETNDLRQRLGPMSLNCLEIRTAKKPMHIREVAELRGKWGDKSRPLGKLDEVRKMELLAPCVPSRQVDEMRRAAGHEVSSSAPVFVLYIFEDQVSGPRPDVKCF